MNESRNGRGLIWSLICLFVLTACGESKKAKTPLSPEQIESKYSSGVVLIKNTFYYTLEFDGTKELYFSGLDAEGNPENLTLDPNELTPSVIFGTGFFISKDGLIATNSHVAAPGVDISSARASIMSYFQSMANEWTKDINNINERLGVLQIAIMSADSYSDQQQYQQMYDQLSQERDSKQEAVNLVQSLGGMDYKATIHTDLGIAYNDTYVTTITDFHDCVPIVDDSDHDLAIIQLKDKTTPEGKHVFKVPSKQKSSDSDDKRKSDSKEVKVGKKLYMIGFNLGPTLALTEQGVKAQVTSGEVSQDTDDTRIMYTISALSGSSGSPVIDKYGKLIAINYAGLGETQNFNYGIKASHLKKLLKDLNDED